MRVKKIELIGFKSFADRTEIHLNPGVTCIVGPNGCGKSNISDAIRWVFGERSAKLLRGSRMEDVIFAGTEFRKPLGMAEVSLTIDNQDHVLPIEYEEVVLTRRMDRSGQSEYFINRTHCRLKDILDLILDTGMGSNSYSMIEQGRVDSVINADPEERRFLIEEAAGISKYKIKKEEALRKLERTEQNLLRIRDIVAEVQKNIQYAERQAKRAERYKTQFDELKRLETRKAFLELEELKMERETEEPLKQSLLQTQSQLEAEFQKISEKETQEKSLLQEILQKETAEASRFYELRSQLNALHQKKEFNRERIETCRYRQIEIQKECEILTVQLKQLEQEFQEEAARRVQLDENQTKFAQVLAEEKSASEKEDRKLEHLREDLAKIKGLLFEKATEQARLKNESHRLRALLERMGHEEAKRCEALEKLSRERFTLEEKQLVYREESPEEGGGASPSESDSDGTRQRLGASRGRLERLTQAIEEKRLKLQEINSRTQLLEELQETAEESQQKILASVSKNGLQGKLVRGLKDVLRIQHGYEAAVEAVLGSFAQALVAGDVETAQGLIEEMSQSHAGPCAIFVQGAMKTSPSSIPQPSFEHPSINRPLREAVIPELGFESLFAPLFENVYLVQDFTPDKLGELLSVAREIKLVTRHGILIGPDSRILFRNGRLSSEQGPFRREAEINDLKKSRQLMQQEIESLVTARLSHEKECDLLEKKWAALEEKKRTDQAKKEAAGSFLRSLHERITNIDQELSLLGVEREELRIESNRHNHDLLEFDKRIQELEIEERNLLLRQQKIEKDLDVEQAARETRIQTLSRLKAILENHETQKQVFENGCELLSRQIRSTQERLEKLRSECRQLEQRTDSAQEEEIFLGKEQEVLSEEQKASEDALSELRGRKAVQEEKCRDLSERLRGIEEKVRSVRENLHREEMKAMETSYKEKIIFERLDQTYHVKLADLNPEEFTQGPVDRGNLEEEIQNLKARVEAFGPVNLLAVEEYEELKQRHDFLSAQEKDLVEARESLLEAIRKINRTTKTLFSDTFAKAQLLFQQYYQTLFGGGHAELILIPNETESGEEGVDIMVRPPGKKLQHISLLSGGEKALTAVAVLFALFRIRPSPLCVLDEVDAPLDEANVDRFLTVLRTFLENTQFFIVTHNRKTIAMGDFLYGVTMEESGVSKLVSVRVATPAEKETKADVVPAA